MKFKDALFALLAAVISMTVVAGAGAASVAPVYNAVPNHLPPNVSSQGFETAAVSEFGDHVRLTGTNRLLKTVTVTMSNWALYSDYSDDPRYEDNASTWTNPITLNVYSSHLNGGGVPDELLATVTQDITIPWRPAADPTCSDPTRWRAADGNCYPGIAFNANFDLSGLNVTLPNEVIVGVAYNTAQYGYEPEGILGPYNSLNVGVPNGNVTTLGTDVETDKVFWNTTYAPYYSDGGSGGVGTFREDSNWAPFGTMALRINAASAQLKLDRASIAGGNCAPKGSKAKLIVNVKGKVINEYAAGFDSTDGWANTTVDRMLKIWQLRAGPNAGKYCAQTQDAGAFETFEGQSPSGFSTVDAGIVGIVAGGSVTNLFDGTFDASLPLKGKVGLFDRACTSAITCPGANLDYSRYFSSKTGDHFDAWGFLYDTKNNGTFLHQIDVPQQSSGDITSER